MRLIINAKKVHGGCTQSMEEKIKEKLDFINNFVNDDEPIKLTLEYSKHTGHFIIKAKTVLKDNYHLYVDGVGESFENALSDLKNDMFDRCKRHKNSRKEYKIRSSKKIKEKNKEKYFKKNDEITKIKLFELLPTSEEDAIEEMERVGHSTYVFSNSNRENAFCMLYRREDGYGIIIFE